MHGSQQEAEEEMRPEELGRMGEILAFVLLAAAVGGSGSSVQGPPPSSASIDHQRDPNSPPSFSPFPLPGREECLHCVHLRHFLALLCSVGCPTSQGELISRKSVIPSSARKENHNKQAAGQSRRKKVFFVNILDSWRS